MGNRVSFDSEPVDFYKLLKMAQQPSQSSAASAATQQQQQRQNTSFISNVKIWSFSPRENDVSETCVQALSAQTVAAEAFKNRHCYVVLHLHQRTAPALRQNTYSQSPLQSTQEISSSQTVSLFRLAVSSAEMLTPRGLEHRFSAGEGVPLLQFMDQVSTSSQQQFKRSSSKSSFDAAAESSSSNSQLTYDIYLWQGKNAHASTQAMAITRAYELERYLMDQQLLETLFYCGRPVPLSHHFHNDIPSLQSVAGGGATGQPQQQSPQQNGNHKHQHTQMFMNLYQHNHLFRYLSHLSDAVHLSPDMQHLKQHFEFDADVGSIKAMLSLPPAHHHKDEKSHHGGSAQHHPAETKPLPAASPHESYSNSPRQPQSPQTQNTAAFKRGGIPPLGPLVAGQLSSRGSPNSDRQLQQPPLSAGTKPVIPTIPRVARLSGSSSSGQLSLSSPRKGYDSASSGLNSNQDASTKKFSMQTPRSSHSTSASGSSSRGSNTARHHVRTLSLSADLTTAAGGGGAPESGRLSSGSSSSFSINLNSVTHRQGNEVYDPSPTPRTPRVRENRPMSGAELVVYYRKICSQILDYLYLGSDLVARNKELLQANGITHIINAALVACDMYFPEEFEYLPLSLYDAGDQSILGSFFATIDFIESAHKNGGKVYVHCYEGVSRSSTLCISYLMWKTRRSYNAVLDEVKAKRAVVSPNAGFIVQLLQWEKMLKDPQTYLFRTAPLNDRFKEHRQVVPKLCNSDVLDSRTSFMLYSPQQQIVYTWHGAKTREELRETTSQFAELFIKYFTNDKAQLVVLEEEEAKTHNNFLAALSTVHIDTRYQVKTLHYKDLDFLDDQSSDQPLIPAITMSPRGLAAPLTKRLQEEDEEEEEDSGVRPSELFVNDGGWELIDNFNFSDFVPDFVYVLKPLDHATHQHPFVFVWVGRQVDLEGQSLEDFCQAKAFDFFASNRMSPIQVRVVQQGKEPQEFKDYVFGFEEFEGDDDDETEETEDETEGSELDASSVSVADDDLDGEDNEDAIHEDQDEERQQTAAPAVFSLRLPIVPEQPFQQAAAPKPQFSLSLPVAAAAAMSVPSLGLDEDGDQRMSDDVSECDSASVDESVEEEQQPMRRLPPGLNLSLRL